MRSKLFYLHTLHFFNDGFSAALLLFLPFIAKDLRLNLSQVGVLGSGLNLLPIFLALPAIFFADKLGRIKILILALGLYGIGFVSLAGAPNFIVLLLMFVLLSIGFGLFHPIAFSTVSRWSESSSIGTNMGNFTAFGDAGRLGIAGFVSLIIVALGWRHTTFLYGAIILIIFGYLFFLRFKKERLAFSAQPVLHLADFKSLLKNKKFILSMLAVGIDNVASNPMFMFLPFLLLAKGISPEFLSIFASAYVAGTLLGKLVLGRFVDKAGSAQVFMVAEIIMAIMLFALTFVHIKWLVILLSLLAGAATKGTVPTTRSMVFESIKESGNHERAHSINDIVSNIAATLGPLILGIVSNRFGINYAFYMAAAICLLAIVPAFLFFKLKKSDSVSV